MSKAFAAILAQRFSPLNFSPIHGFPNSVPSTDEWQHHLLRFREDEDEYPAKYLIAFHELMHLLDVFHEDVLMKIFVFSLYGDACKWFRSLPAGTIYYLKEFHEMFHHYCKGIYSFELFLGKCCE